MRDPAQSQRARAEMAADQEHDHVADQHAGQPDRAHHAHIRVAEARDDAAGDQRNVFGNRHAEAADQQHDEHREVAVHGEQGDQVIEKIHRGIRCGQALGRDVGAWMGHIDDARLASGTV